MGNLSRKAPLKNKIKISLIQTVTALLLLCTMTNASLAASIISLSDLFEQQQNVQYNPTYFVSDLSGDGSTVIFSSGEGNRPGPQGSLYQYKNGQITALYEANGDVSTHFYRSSYDGSVIAGTTVIRSLGSVELQDTVFQDGVAQSVESYTGIDGFVIDVGNDGTLVMGETEQLYRPDGSIVELQQETPFGGPRRNFLMSRDSNSVFGVVSDTLTNNQTIFRHDVGMDSYTDLGEFQPLISSFDGSILVGRTLEMSGPIPSSFVYDNGSLIEVLGDWISPQGMSSDGRITIGTGGFRNRLLVLLRDMNGEYSIGSLVDYLFSQGISLPRSFLAGGSSSEYTLGLSDDGDIMVLGVNGLFNPELYLIDLSPTQVPLPAALWLFLFALSTFKIRNLKAIFQKSLFTNTKT